MRLNRYGWHYLSEKSEDENYLDLAYLLARNSIAIDGHMGCCVVTEEKDIIVDAINYGFYQSHRSEIHAEAGAIAEAAKRGLSLKNAALYVTKAPCPRCYLLIATSGIRKIVAPNQMTPREHQSLEAHGILYNNLPDTTDRARWREDLARLHRDEAAILQAREERKLFRKQYCKGQKKADNKAASHGVSPPDISEEE